MIDLVRLEKNKPVISTFDLYERMGYFEHRKLKEVINDQKEAFDDLGFLPLEREKPTAKKGGRPTESYLLNEDHFILLVLLAKNTKQSVELKIRVSKEFKRLKNVVASIAAQKKDSDWQNVRSDGKIVYKQKTDVIDKFVKYCDESGSKSASRYFGNLARMENKALFIVEQKYKNLREILTIKQLMQASTADDVIEKALTEGMDQGLDYHDIFKLAKARVIAFANIIGKSQVHNLIESTKRLNNVRSK